MRPWRIAVAYALILTTLPLTASFAYAARVVIDDKDDHDLVFCLDLNGDEWFLTDDFDDFVYFSDEVGSLEFKKGDKAKAKSGHRKHKGSFKDEKDIHEEEDDEDISGSLKGSFKIGGKGKVILRDKTNGVTIKIRDDFVEREDGDCNSRGHPGFGG